MTLVCPLLGQPMLDKVIFLASAPCLWDSLACHVAEAILDSVTKCSLRNQGRWISTSPGSSSDPEGYCGLLWDMVTICRLKAGWGAGVGPSQGEWHEVAGASALCGLGVRGHASSLRSPAAGVVGSTVCTQGREEFCQTVAFPHDHHFILA